ncbi:MAG: hypothetical protein AVDCRST_MAG56-1480 [uncultured Cytophagales bacterium]|uniref:Uncharacterized protein n=1 Tax=uncultured Cytophagales bacterium TaxID=158755 RepID=A0A6J4I7H4_9SPHI|nr:MAG: hypothetical protein AVDCRST_MAG56-1480 [uncultured Cytophagales bacterium]
MARMAGWFGGCRAGSIGMLLVVLVLGPCGHGEQQAPDQ